MPNFIEIGVFEHDLVLRTENELFAPRRADAGTLAMLKRIEVIPTTKVLDLGCGYGIVGIAVAQLTRPDLVYLIDNNEQAISCARSNAIANGVPDVHVILSNGFTDFFEADFDLILCNPPYHVDFSVPKHFIEKGFNRLAIGGAMYLVTKRNLWYRNKLKSIFGAVQVWREGEYFVFKATKKSANYANKPKTGRRHGGAKTKYSKL